MTQQLMALLFSSKIVPVLRITVSLGPCPERSLQALTKYLVADDESAN